MDIGNAEIDVDETVELMDPSALTDKMVLMPVGEAGQNQDDISECVLMYCPFHTRHIWVSDQKTNVR